MTTVRKRAILKYHENFKKQSGGDTCLKNIWFSLTLGILRENSREIYALSAAEATDEFFIESGLCEEYYPHVKAILLPQGTMSWGAGTVRYFFTKHPWLNIHYATIQ